MASPLDRKLWRDLRRMKGQAMAVSLVMACGLAMMIMARSLMHSLDSTRREYYEANRFAEVFVALKRAPISLADRLAALPGIAALQPSISVQVTLDIPGLDEPASGNVRSLPDQAPPELKRLFLRSGRWLAPGGRDEVLVSEAFAAANQLQPGHQIAMLMNGKRRVLTIAGIVLSPEFVFESRPGAALPDNRTYGIFSNEDVDFCHRLKQKGCHIITDPEIQVIHLGTPQNYHALYKKELWHGTGALQTFVNDLRKVRKMRPVLYAAFYSFCITAIILCFIMSILAQSQFALILLLIFTGMLLIIPLGLALNVLHGQRRYNLLFGVWMVYLTYGVGRANCLFRYLGKKRK